MQIYYTQLERVDWVEIVEGLLSAKSRDSRVSQKMHMK